jgi:hypothetical protein
MLKTEWKMLWLGADNDPCEGRVGLEQRALDFANNFNIKMSELIIENPRSYACIDSI